MSQQSEDQSFVQKKKKWTHWDEKEMKWAQCGVGHTSDRKNFGVQFLSTINRKEKEFRMVWKKY